MTKNIFSYSIAVLACLLLAVAIVFIHYESDNIQLAMTEMGFLNFDSAPYFIRIFVGFCWALYLFAALPTLYRKWAIIRVAFVSAFILLFAAVAYFYHAAIIPIYFTKSSVLLLVLPATLALVFALLSIYFFNSVVWQKLNKVMTVILFLLLVSSGIAASFAMNPVAQKVKNKTTPPDLLASLKQEGITTPTLDFSKGKHIVMIASYTCPHCKTAAKKFRVLNQLHPELPLKIILAGKETKRANFFTKTGIQQVPNYLLNNDSNFWILAQNSIPAIYLVNNGQIEKRVHYSQINAHDFLAWLQQ